MTEREASRFGSRGGDRVLGERSSPAMGRGGGDSLGTLMADSRNIGEDLATFMARWARGDSLTD